MRLIQSEKGGIKINIGLNLLDFIFLVLALANLILISAFLMARQPEQISKKDTAAVTKKSQADDITKNIDIKDPLATKEFIHLVQKLVPENCSPDRPGVILCIGSDRCTGDCLGPLVGNLLEKTMSDRYRIYGTLREPVHALNLKKYLREIRFRYNHPFIIAIDASLGSSRQDIGTVIINKGRLHPGSAMHKPLPPVGDISIVGVVNNFHGLSSTRLYRVTKLANFIATGLQRALTSNKNEDISKIS